MLSVLIIPYASVPYNADGTITPSYKHFIYPQSYIAQHSSQHSSHTLSGRTGSALVWRTRARVFDLRLLQQVLRRLVRVYTMQYVELKGYCL